MEFSPHALSARLALPGGKRPPRIWVAYSGGLDSTVLLRALAAIREDLSVPLHAVHVNHGLHASAAEWAAHCAAVCRHLDIPLESFGVTVDGGRGASIEAAAREVRYDVFRELLAKDEWLLTAQHQDDQLETFLLQALRGAGPHGLAAMPRHAPLGKGQQLRPLLDWPRQALESWAKAGRLDWLEDPSNRDDRFDRNYLRRQVVPLLKARWPSAAATLARSARHCAEAAALADEFAAADLAACARGRTLDIATLQRLDLPRRRNLLRHWLDWQGFPRPSERKIQHILDDVLPAAPDAEPCVDWADAAVHRYRGRLYVERRLAPPAGGDWRQGDFDLGQGWGVLRREPATQAGLPDDSHVEIRFRQGGEVLRPLGREHHHELRKLFQESGVLPWRRGGLPLIYLDGELAAVADLWLNADLAVKPGWRVRWEHRPPICAES